jgi:hypothetical protein
MRLSSASRLNPDQDAYGNGEDAAHSEALGPYESRHGIQLGSRAWLAIVGRRP